MHKTAKEFSDRFDERLKAAKKEKVKIVIKEQYKEAFEVLEDCENSGLIPGLIGPPGVGKTLLLRAYAEKSNRDFEWLTGVFEQDKKYLVQHGIMEFDIPLMIDYLKMVGE